MAERDQTRTYSRKDSVVFLKTDAPFGGLSNMAGGYPIHVNGVRILTSEALYQVCRFPHLPDVQKLIIGQISPMTAKMRSKPYRKDSRPDWDQVRVRIMRWSLRMKLANNWNTFSALLLKSGDRPIVEESRKDAFWGAKVVDDGDTLVGMNVLGRLLMELREQVKQQGRDAALDIAPPDIPQFLLFGGRLKWQRVRQRRSPPKHRSKAPSSVRTWPSQSRLWLLGHRLLRPRRPMKPIARRVCAGYRPCRNIGTSSAPRPSSARWTNARRPGGKNCCRCRTSPASRRVARRT